MVTSKGRSRATPTDDEQIVRDPEALLGKPTIRGTRMPVYIIVGLVEVGMTPEEIVDDFPDLRIEDVEAAIEYGTRAPETIDLPLH